MTKQERHEAIRERARAAIRNLYHNATPHFPRDLRGRSEDYAQQWFNDAAEQEIEYMQDGGATPGDYRETLEHPANAGKYHSEAARRFYVASKLRARDLERADCGALTGWRVLEIAVLNSGGRVRPGASRARVLTARNDAELERSNALWERISEYGKLYTWGRGGRTLAPRDLVRERGGSGFSVREDYADEMRIASVVDLIRIVESFNAAVERWNSRENLEFMWLEQCKCEESAEREARKRARAEAKESARREMLRKCFI